MEAMAIAHEEKQEYYADVQNEPDDDERDDGYLAVPAHEIASWYDVDAIQAEKAWPHDNERNDVDEDEGRLVDDEPHDHDGSGI